MDYQQSPDLILLGKFIRDRRKELGLTQTQLGERVGWLQERISVLERGKYGLPSLPALETLAAALESPLTVLLNAAGFLIPLESSDTGRSSESPGEALFYTLQQLLAIDAMGLQEALNEAADLLAQALGANKIDAFIREPETETLVAIGRSNTPMAQRQYDLGLHRMAIANGGKVVDVFQSGRSFITCHADQEPGIPFGVVNGLGVRSSIMVPLDVGNERRGVLEADSSDPDHFSEGDLEFLTAVARWVGIIAHRAELAELLAQHAAESARRLAAEEMITFLAHDLDNLLTPTVGHLDILLRRLSRENQAENLHNAKAATDGLLRIRYLTNALLDVSRLDHGILSLVPQPVDLALLVRDAARRFESQGDVLEVQTPEELVVHADPLRIDQVLHNIISNAVKHGQSGAPVVIDLKTEPRQGGTRAIITVMDAGPGISPELVPTLFTRFARGPQSTGLGLGLYLARGIAVAHGGNLELESAPDTGTTVRFSLPIQKMTERQRRTSGDQSSLVRFRYAEPDPD